LTIDNGSVRFWASDGETNALHLTVDGDWVSVVDHAAPVTAWSACEQVDSSTARCSVPPTGPESRITVTLGDGDDRLTVSGRPVSILARGGPGDDVLQGGEGPDRLAGGGGSNRLVGNGGDDELDNGRGVLDAADRFDGGAGDDRILGFTRGGSCGEGDDLVIGGFEMLAPASADCERVQVVGLECTGAWVVPRPIAVTSKTVRFEGTAVQRISPACAESSAIRRIPPWPRERIEEPFMRWRLVADGRALGYSSLIALRPRGRELRIVIRLNSRGRRWVSRGGGRATLEPRFAVDAVGSDLADESRDRILVRISRPR
jgi:hypothetical protein